jgi:D-arabinose 1-dehydrogenase-like Zn-dependent alcohol dehydrogenase
METCLAKSQDLLETLNFAAEHGIRPRIKKYPLTRAADALDTIEHGQPACRVVLVNEN